MALAAAKVAVCVIWICTSAVLSRTLHGPMALESVMVRPSGLKVAYGSKFLGSSVPGQPGSMSGYIHARVRGGDKQRQRERVLHKSVLAHEGLLAVDQVVSHDAIDFPPLGKAGHKAPPHAGPAIIDSGLRAGVATSCDSALNLFSYFLTSSLSLAVAMDYSHNWQFSRAPCRAITRAPPNRNQSWR